MTCNRVIQTATHVGGKSDFESVALVSTEYNRRGHVECKARNTFLIRKTNQDGGVQP